MILPSMSIPPCVKESWIIWFNYTKISNNINLLLSSATEKIVAGFLIYKGIRRLLAPMRGFEPPTYRLGEPLNICHLCSPMYRKVAIRQAFFVFRVAPCSSKFTGVVRCSPVHFSSFLDFSKKGNKNIFHLPPILAHFRVKIHLQSNRKPKRNISRLPEKHSLGKTIKKRVLHSRFE